MIINRLELYNFRQYIGYQSVDFSTDTEKNVTVLIGINTSGKTTIVRAFEWCLYGKNGFEDPVLLNSEVRANMNVGDVQDTWVSVNFTHDNKEYTLRRLFKYVCSEHKVASDGTVEVSLNKKPEERLTLEYLQSDGQTKTPIDRSNITESMDRVLPRDLSDYFFFGGERISSIANRTDLSKAVRGLMRLDVLENARDHLGRVLKSFQGSIDTSGDANAQRAKDAIETYKIKLAQYEQDKANADQQMQYWNDKEKEYSAELAKSDVEQVRKAKAERDRLEKTIASEKQRLENAVKAMVDAFNTRPFVFFGMPALKKTMDVLESVKASTECVPGMDQDSIDYLLKRGYCICGTHLDPNTLPYQRVMEERRKLPPEQIGAVVMNYKNKTEGYMAGNENFLTNLESRYKDIRSIQRTLGFLQDDYDKQAGIIVDDTDAKAIEAKRKDAHAHYIEAKSDYDQATQSIGRCKENISNCEATISRYAKNSKKNERTYRMIAYSQDVYEWLNRTYQEKENTVRSQLQQRVNDNFSRMYHGERSIIIDDKYRVRYSDIKTEESDGLKAVKSFAFIASLVSMAKDKILDDQEMQLGQVYPLVMDAPFSNVDEIHIDNICKFIPQTANQVIMAVMQKDWGYAANDLAPFVGKSYVIAKDIDAEGHEIDTSTHIVPAEV